MRGQILAELFDHHRLIVRPVADVHFGLRVAFVDDEVRADAGTGLVAVAVDKGGCTAVGTQAPTKTDVAMSATNRRWKVDTFASQKSGFVDKST